MQEEPQSLRTWVELGLGLALTVLFFYMMAPFLVAMMLGAVIAIVCYPIYFRLRKYLPRMLAALFTTLGITVGLLLPVLLLIYDSAHRLLGMIGQFHLGSATVLNLTSRPSIANFVRRLGRVMPVDPDWLHDQVAQVSQSVIENTTKSIAVFLSSMPSLLLAIVVVILSAYFLLVDGSRFLRFLSNVSPLGRDRSTDLYGTFEKSCRGVVIGLFASSVAQAMIIGTFFNFTGIPSPWFAAAVTFVFGMVPVIGSAPVWIGGMLYFFVNGHIFSMVLILTAGVLIIVIDNLLRSLIMKGQSEMHPLLALVSVFGAVNLLGPTGIFLGPIIAAVFVSFLKIIGSDMRH